MIVVKMSALVYSLFILFSFASLISGNKHVPVLLWSPTVDIPTVPGLKHISSVTFNELLQDALAPKNPLVVVFLEENLSSEDFVPTLASGNSYPSLSSISSDNNVKYYSSVSNPMKTIQHLTEIGYESITFSGKIPRDLSKPMVLVVPLSDESSYSNLGLSHSETITKIYGELLSQTKNILAIFTGRFNPQKELSRVRRDADVDEPISNDKIIKYNSTYIVFENIFYQETADTNPINLSQPTSITGTDSNNTIIISAQFDKVVIKFNMSASEESWYWSLNNVDVNGEVLVPSVSIQAPYQWSYACSKNLTFAPESSKNSSQFPAINITRLQLQPFTDGERFNYSVDCVPYFNIEIWSALFVIFIMLSILTWGLMMLMDVNTNDRFDDPKGKTITISATD